jgi:hypothetical protein
VIAKDFLYQTNPINKTIHFIICTVPTNAHTHTHTYIYIYIKILNYVTNVPTYFGVSVPSSESFDIAFAKVIKY